MTSGHGQHVAAAAASPQQGEVGSRTHQFRLRGFSWLVLLATALAMTIIIAPGANRTETDEELIQSVLGDNFNNFVVARGNSRNLELPIREHGWPLVFLRRYVAAPPAPAAPPTAGAVPTLTQLLAQTTTPPATPLAASSPRLGISWLSPAAWSFTKDNVLFSWPGLLADIAIALAIVAIAVGCCDRWRRKRGRLRFSLFDALLWATLACVALGWAKYHARGHAREEAIIRQLNSSSFATDLSLSWVANLARTTSPATTYGTAVYQGPEWLLRLAGDHPSLSIFFHTTHLTFGNAARFADEELRALRELTYVEHVTLTAPLSPDTTAALAELPRLRELSLTSGPFDNLARLPGLESVDLSACGVDADDLQIVHELPRLRSLAIRAAHFLIEDLEPLARHAALREVDANISATDDEKRAFSAAHPMTRIQISATQHAIQPDFGDPWHVANVRIARWRGHGLARSLWMPRSGFLNVRRALLTAERLQQLPPHVFADLTEVCIDDFDSLETVFALVERSPRVEFIELRTQLLKGADLARLCRLSSLRGLKIQQGALTPDDLCQLARLQRFKWLEVYAATLTRSEALRIREALRQNNADTVMDAWRGNDKSEYSILDARYAHIGE